MKIGFFGSSHLSIVSAICATKKVAAVNGIIYCYVGNDNIFDSDKTLKIKEPELDNILEEYKSNILFVTEISALQECDMVYIAVDTPTNDKGQADLTVIEAAVNKVIPNLSGTCLLIVHSQVTPCFTRQINFPHERLFYQVETLIFGRAVERALYPERFIIGGVSKNNTLPSVYDQYLTLYNCPKFLMVYESAELAKISINLFLTASVTTSNTLAEVCEKIGADWGDIATTLRLDKRIGAYAYLNAGLGISGGNLERDLIAIKNLAYAQGVEASIVESEIESSKYYKNWALRILKRHILNERNDLCIGILGLTYKENTNSIKNSPSIQLIKQLTNLKLYAYDPIIKSLPSDVHPNLELCDMSTDVLKKAQVLIIMTPWDEFRELDYNGFSNEVIDPYGIVKNTNISHRKIYQRGIYNG